MNRLFSQEKRKRNLILIAAGVGVSCVLWLTFGITETAEKPLPPTPKVELVDKKSTVEEGFKAKFADELKEIKKEQADIKRGSEKLAAENERLKSELLSMPAPPPPPPAMINLKPSQPVTPPAPPQVVVMSGLVAVGQPLSVPEKPISEQKKKSRQPDLVIPAGSFVRAELLSGVTAPTMGNGTADPAPSLIRITGLAQLPNFFKADIKECFLLAETKGSLATELVSFRLKTLSCKTTHGETIERNVDGYVAGENGMEGLTGRVVSKQATMLGRTFIAEFIGGLSGALESSSQTISTSAQGVVSTIDPSKALQNGVFSGASAAASKLAEFYMELANEMVPVIEINAGRKVDVIFIRQVNLSEDGK